MKTEEEYQSNKEDIIARVKDTQAFNSFQVSFNQLLVEMAAVALSREETRRKARDAKIRELVEEALEKERKDENRVSSNGEYFLTIIKEIKRVLNGV